MIRQWGLRFISSSLTNSQCCVLHVIQSKEVKVLPATSSMNNKHVGEEKSFNHLAVWNKKSAKSRIQDTEHAWSVNDAEDEEVSPPSSQ